MGEKASLKATALCNALRIDGFKVQTDICAKGLKAQMKFANKIGALFTLVLGDNELENNKANLKNMQTGEQTEICLDNLSDELLSAVNKNALENLTNSIID